jgi:hypothetical protein
MTRVPFRLTLARIRLKICSGTTVALVFVAAAPALVLAGGCPTSASEIATDRPDVTNSSLVVPAGSLQSENGINTTRHGLDKTFDATNSRLRLGIANCVEILVDRLAESRRPRPATLSAISVVI